MEEYKVLIIGGTGSLGTELTSRYLKKDNLSQIYLFSRDEAKHWSLNIEYNYNPRINFIIGNIADQDKIKQTLIRHNFKTIILAAAMKHVDKCEYETNECLNTNLLGTKYVLDQVEFNLPLLTNLKEVCFISTDKACSPVNIYGMTKAISESLMIEKSKYIPQIKFVTVRYGNVLNSRGSIIPTLHKLGSDPKIDSLKLTDPRMTRFVMTLSQSIDLIFYALEQGESGDIVIPQLISCKIKDLLDIFSQIYQKPVVLDKLRPGEKMLESLINETQSMRIQTDPSGYIFIKPNYRTLETSNNLKDYNSSQNTLSKSQLGVLLQELNLI